MGVVSYGRECPSYGVYARVTEVKHWIQFMAQGAEDTNCFQDIPVQQGNVLKFWILKYIAEKVIIQMLFLSTVDNWR